MTSNDTTLYFNIVKLIFRAILVLIRRSLLATFVLTLVLPIMTSLVVLSTNGLEQLSVGIIYVLFFPQLLIQNKENFGIGDVVLTFVIWNIIFEFVGRLSRFITHRKQQAYYRTKVLHRAYLASYVIGFGSIPFVKLNSNVNVGALLGAMLIFFILGYVILGIFILINRIEEHLDRLPNNLSVKVTRKSSF